MNTETKDGALDFCLRLARAQAALVRRLDGALGNVHGISFSDFQLLYHLSRATGTRLRRTDLADRLALTASGVTRALLPLEKIGLVERQADPRDARVGFAVLTATGVELLNNATETAQLICHDLLRGSEANDMTALAELLGKIAGIHAANA